MTLKSGLHRYMRQKLQTRQRDRTRDVSTRSEQSLGRTGFLTIRNRVLIGQRRSAKLPLLGSCAWFGVPSQIEHLEAK